MPASIRKRITFANVTAVVALFVALGGTSMAAVSLKRGSVKGKHIARNAVTSPKVKNGSLRAADFAPGQLRGARGAAGSDAQFQGASAGGALAGTDPSPQVADGAITASKFGAVPAVRAWDGAAVSHGNSCASFASNATEHPICFFQESYDDSNMHAPFALDNDASRLTAPRAGLYAVAAGVVWSADSGTGVRQFSIRKNGSTYVAGEQLPAAPTGTATIQNVSGVVRLAASDYVQAMVLQNTGGNLNVSSSSDQRSFFEAHWVGP